LNGQIRIGIGIRGREGWAGEEIVHRGQEGESRIQYGRDTIRASSGLRRKQQVVLGVWDDSPRLYAKALFSIVQI